MANGLGRAGVLVVLVGSAILTSEPRDQAASALTRAQRVAGIRDRLLSTIMTATASVFLKQALALSTEWQALAAWSWLGWLMGLAWMVFLRVQKSAATTSSASRRDWQATLLVAVSSVDHARLHYRPLRSYECRIRFSPIPNWQLDQRALGASTVR